jgi:uncharacterized protein (DUF362 family)
VTRRWTRRELGILLGGAVATARVDGTERSGDGLPAPGVVGVAPLSPNDSGRLDAAVVARAMDSVLSAAGGGLDPGSVLSSLFRPSDVVGIKLNCLGGRRMSPRPVVVEALVNRLVDAGVRPDQIILFERSSRELERAGFEVRRGGRRPQCFGTDNDYDRTPSISGSIGSCFARLVSETCTALISFGVVKDHDLAGVSAGLKNWYGVIHNPNKYHDNQCDPYVADVVRHPLIRDKLKLTVLDGVTAQCHGGPAFRSSGVFGLGRLAASTDPVAADLWAWKVIDTERVKRGMPTLEAAGRPPRFIATAARYGLGVGSISEIREVEARA